MLGGCGVRLPVFHVKHFAKTSRSCNMATTHGNKDGKTTDWEIG